MTELYEVDSKISQLCTLLHCAGDQDPSDSEGREQLMNLVYIAEDIATDLRNQMNEVYKIMAAKA